MCRLLMDRTEVMIDAHDEDDLLMSSQESDGAGKMALKKR